MRGIACHLFTLCAAVSLLAVLLSLDVGFQDRTIVVRLKWYHLPLLFPPLIWVVREANRRFEARQRIERSSAGLCPSCAYDLRGSPAGGGRCPECGAERPEPPVTPDA